MREYYFDTVTERRGTACIKYDSAMKIMGREDLLPLWVADMDFEVPEAVQNAMRKRMEHGIFGYTEPSETYKESVVSWFRRRHGWTLSPEEITVTPGVVFSIAQAVLAFTEPGDSVLIQKPVYRPFETAVVQNGRVAVNNALVNREGRYEIDFQDFERKIREKAVRLFILCSPHNPVGRVWTEEELKRMAEICRDYGVTVVSDEIHCDFIWKGAHFVSWASAAKEYGKNYIICTSPSKTFNLAGMQTSNTIIQDETLRRRFRAQVAASGYSEINPLSMAACEAAYKEGEPWLDALLAYLSGNIALMRQYMGAHLPEIRMTEPEGSYLIWLDFSGLGLSYPALKDMIVNEAKLWLNPGKLFDGDAELFARVNIACPRSVLEQALEQLRTAVELHR